MVVGGRRRQGGRRPGRRVTVRHRVMAVGRRTAAVAYSGQGRRWRWVASGRMHRAGPAEVAYSGLLVGGQRAHGAYQAPRLCREAWSAISTREVTLQGTRRAILYYIRHDVARYFVASFTQALTYLCRRQAAEPLPTQCSGPSQAPRRLVVVR